MNRYAPVAWQTLHLEYLDSENEWNMLEDDGDLLNAHAQTGGTLKVRELKLCDVFVLNYSTPNARSLSSR